MATFEVFARISNRNEAHRSRPRLPPQIAWASSGFKHHTALPRVQFSHADFDPFASANAGRERPVLGPYRAGVKIP